VGRKWKWQFQSISLPKNGQPMFLGSNRQHKITKNKTTNVTPPLVKHQFAFLDFFQFFLLLSVLLNT